jgi:hypothetical protein
MVPTVSLCVLFGAVFFPNIKPPLKSIDKMIDRVAVPVSGSPTAKLQ